MARQCAVFPRQGPFPYFCTGEDQIRSILESKHSQANRALEVELSSVLELQYGVINGSSKDERASSYRGNCFRGPFRCVHGLQSSRAHGLTLEHHLATLCKVRVT